MLKHPVAAAGVMPLLVAVMAWCLGSTTALGLVLPVGTEFRVNTYTPGDQYQPAVAMSPNGDFIVVWTSAGQDGDQLGLRAQRYASSGGPVGSEFQVNTYTLGYQHAPAVGTDVNRNVFAVWASYVQDGSLNGIFAQRYDSAGASLGTEFQVNTYTPAGQFGAAVTTRTAGDFMVVWESSGQDGDSSGIFGQRFSSSGTAVGTEFQVNTYTYDLEFAPAIDVDSAGEFVVVWQRFYSFVSYGPPPAQVAGQRFTSSGAALGTEFTVSNSTAFPFPNNVDPAVAADPVGGFVIVWSSGRYSYCIGCDYHPVGRRYDAAGNPVTAVFNVSSNQSKYPTAGADVAVGPANDFVVVWSGRPMASSSNYEILGQNVISNNTRLGSEFLVNTYTQGLTAQPVVADDGAGHLVAVWSNTNQDGSGKGVFGRRFIFFTPPPTPTLMPTNTPGTPSATPTVTPTAPTRTPTNTPVATATLQAGCPSAPDFGCFAAQRHFLLVKDKPNDVHDLVKWKWRSGFFTLAQTDFGNPVSGGTGYRLCIYDTTLTVPTLKLGALIGAGGNCPTSPCWKPLSNKGYKYRNPGTNAQGIKKIILKGGSFPAPQVIVIGKGTNLALPGPISGSEYFDQNPTVVIQLNRTDSPACWQSTFGSSINNSAEQFKANIN